MLSGLGLKPGAWVSSPMRQFRKRPRRSGVKGRAEKGPCWAGGGTKPETAQRVFLGGPASEVSAAAGSRASGEEVKTGAKWTWGSLTPSGGVEVRRHGTRGWGGHPEAGEGGQSMSQEGRREVLQREGVALRGLTWGDGEVG